MDDVNFPKIDDFDSAQILDMNKALKRVSYKKELLNRVLNIFRNNLLEKQKIIESGLKNKKWKDLRVISHGIKGSSWTIGAQQLGNVAFSLEKAADNEDYQLYNHLFQIFKICIESFIEFVEMKIPDINF